MSQLKLNSLDDCCFLLKKLQASELILAANCYPYIRNNNTLEPIPDSQTIIEPGDVRNLMESDPAVSDYCLTSDGQKSSYLDELDAKGQISFTKSFHKEGRFRITAFSQRGEISLLITAMKMRVPKLVNELLLPSVLEDLSLASRGLIIISGAPGSGRTTALASMIDHRNSSMAGQILSIEDPIEYMHKHKECVVHQREVGMDAPDIITALQHVRLIRPDMLTVDEVRTSGELDALLGNAYKNTLTCGVTNAHSVTQSLTLMERLYRDADKPRFRSEMASNLLCALCVKLVPTVHNQLAAVTEYIVIQEQQELIEFLLAGDYESLGRYLTNNSGTGSGTAQTFEDSMKPLNDKGLLTALR